MSLNKKHNSIFTLFFAIFLFLSFFFLTQNTYAQDCSQTADCAGVGGPGVTCYCLITNSQCVPTGYCIGSIQGSGFCSCATAGTCNSTWSDCFEGYRWRVCNGNLQIQACAYVPPGGGPGGPGGPGGTASCAVGFTPSATSIQQSATQVLTASVVMNGATLDRVDFSSSNPSSVSISPSTDNTSLYQTTATGQTPGSSTITANVISGGSVLCSNTATVTVLNSAAWWQVRDGDVTAANGNISSTVPVANLFNTNGTGGFPGVPVYSGGLSVTPGTVSTTNWSANTNTTLSRIFDYNYFSNLIPDNITPTTNPSLLASGGFTSDGYEWFRITGDTTLNAINFLNRRVILFVQSGNLTINGNINVNNGAAGSGFFGAFVDGNIVVNPTVTGTPSLEGVYMSDGVFSTGVGNLALHVRGSVASYGGISLQRDLSNNAVPAELFEYAPDQILLFPKKLAYKRTKWTEIAP